MRGVPARVRSLGRLAECAILLAPGLALLLLAAHGGGFFAQAMAMTTIAALALVALRVTLAPRPFAGISRGFVAAAVALAAFAVWTLASSGWSDAPARALLEYDRVLLYLAVLVLFGLLGRSGARARILARSAGAGANGGGRRARPAAA